MPHIVSLSELKKKLAGEPAPRLVEALPVRYFQEGHLPSASHMPHDQIAELAPAALPDRSADIIIYCASATCQNSHKAAAALERLGYSNVSVFAGGKQEWVEAGLPLERA